MRKLSLFSFLAVAISFLALGGAPSLLNAATLTVTTDANSGAGSLRQAVADAAPGDTITFDAGLDGETIVLASQISVGKALTIDGAGLNVTISGNDATRIFEVGAGGDLTLNGLTLTRGSGERGGAIENLGGELTITNSILEHNTATGTVEPNRGGGAIFAESSAGMALVLIDSTLDGNENVSSSGGAIHVGGSSLIQNTTLSNNRNGLDAGGAIYYGNEAPEDHTILNSTLSGNESNADGGAIYNDADSLRIINSTITDNSIGFNGEGSAIYNSVGDLELVNSIVAGNEGGPNCDGDLSGITSSASLSDDDSCSGTAEVADINLGPLQDNGGPTQTHNLLAGSPAIDAGDQATCDAITPNTDQRGFPRTFNGNCDLGAVEVGVTDLSVSKTGPDSVFSGQVATYAITVTNHGPDTALGVEVTDTMIGGSIIEVEAPAGGSCSGSGEEAVCELPDIDVGESVTIVVHVQAPETDGTTGMLNQAELSSDTNPFNNAAEVETSVIAAVNPVQPPVGPGNYVPPEQPASPTATEEPTEAPTEVPTATAEPTEEPTEPPTATATSEPTEEPTEAPTATATSEPTVAPTIAEPTATATPIREAPMPPDTGSGGMGGGGSTLWLALAGLAVAATGALALRRGGV